MMSPSATGCLTVVVVTSSGFLVVVVVVLSTGVEPPSTVILRLWRSRLPRASVYLPVVSIIVAGLT